MSAENKKLNSLIYNRRKWLSENMIQDWTNSDTKFVAIKYANIKAREAAEKALEVAATMNHNSTPVSDGFIEHYLKSNYPLTKNTEG